MVFPFIVFDYLALITLPAPCAPTADGSEKAVSHPDSFDVFHISINSSDKQWMCRNEDKQPNVDVFTHDRRLMWSECDYFGSRSVAISDNTLVLGGL